MKRFFAMAATLMLALTGVPASGQTDEQIRDYLTNDECYWPDFQRNPSFKICPPEDMVRATGGRDGPGWIVTPHWRDRLVFSTDHHRGLTVTYSSNVYERTGFGGLCNNFVSFVVRTNPDMATKGEQTHAYGYDLTWHFAIPKRNDGNRNRPAYSAYSSDTEHLERLYKHEVLAIVDAAFLTLGVSGGNHGVECTNQRYKGGREHSVLHLWPDNFVENRRSTWDGWRRPFDYQPEFRVIREGALPGYQYCNPELRIPP